MRVYKRRPLYSPSARYPLCRGLRASYVRAMQRRGCARGCSSALLNFEFIPAGSGWKKCKRIDRARTGEFDGIRCILIARERERNKLGERGDGEIKFECVRSNYNMDFVGREFVDAILVLKMELHGSSPTEVV